LKTCELKLALERQPSESYILISVIVCLKEISIYD